MLPRLSAVLFATAWCAWAQAPTVCPATAAEFDGTAPRTAAFERISIFDGPPAEMADLAPSSERTAGTRITQTWDLTSYSESKVYLVCRYRGTEITFTRILPSSTRACVLEFTLTSGRITGASTMSCR